MKPMTALTKPLAAMPQSLWRDQRGASVVEYGLAAAMLLTVVGGIDSVGEPATVNDRAACAAIERRGDWLDKDRIAEAFSEEACLAERPEARTSGD